MSDNNCHLSPHIREDPGRIVSVARRFHQKKKLFPKRNIHQISNVKLKIDGIDRFKSDYQHRFEKLEARRVQSLEFEPNDDSSNHRQRQLTKESFDQEAAGLPYKLF